MSFLSLPVTPLTRRDSRHPEAPAGADVPC